MTKRHFAVAAAQVKAILEGHWTHDSPTWANGPYSAPYLLDTGSGEENYTRAVQTAEAYILLFYGFNPLFNEQTFLIACGLAEKPAKTRKRA